MVFHCQSTVIFRQALLSLGLLLLVGCHALESRDLDGKPYQNDQERFYAPEKRAKKGANGYVYRWNSGELEGYCSETVAGSNSGQQKQVSAVSQSSARHLVDTVTIRNTSLFDPGSAVISELGRRSLEQLVRRLTSYEDIIRLEVHGHTDGQGTIEYNQQLSENRVKSVREYLNERLTVKIPIRGVGRGELEPKATNSTGDGRALNRRVEVKVVATRVRSDNTDSTLCLESSENVAGNAYGADSQSSNNDHLNPKWKLEKHTGPLPISVGDHIRFSVAGDDNFNGIYEVTIGGGIDLPLLGSVPVHGLTIPAIKKAVGERLVEKQLIKSHALSVDTSVQQWAPINVFVRGAVFSPGRITINVQKPEERVFINSRNSGDYALDRLLSVALYQSGGVRPDADLSRIKVLRNGNEIEVDLSGVTTGRLVKDLPLVSGDEIVVPTNGVYKIELIRPSPITPPGIRVFISNPTVPILTNGGAAFTKDAFNIPYGTRFLRGLINANCVGGTQHTNASRRGVLVSTNPLTGATEVIERSVQQLISDPDRDDINPHLMPNDGIACYDSEVSNIRDVARSLSDLLAPIVDLTSIFDGR